MAKFQILVIEVVETYSRVLLRNLGLITRLDVIIGATVFSNVSSGVSELNVQTSLSVGGLPTGLYRFRVQTSGGKVSRVSLVVSKQKAKELINNNWV